MTPGNTLKTAVVAGCLSWLTACGGAQDDDVKASREPAFTADQIEDQTVLAVTEYLAQAPYDGADRERGKGLYLQCRACHSIEAGGRTMIGPNLHGIFGRQAGAGADFDYSGALESARFIWTPEAMDAWITNPSRFLPGHRMSYAGMSRQEDRHDLIAWMLETSAR